MSEQIRPEQNNVVQLNPERTTGQPPAIILARLPAAMHSLRDKARQQLQGLLRDLFDKVDDAMFELADKANNNHEQNLYFDSMREVRLRRRAMETAFFRSIDIRFAQLLDHNAYRDELQAEAKEFSLDDLSLVKNDDLEEMVAIEGMVNKANEQFAEPIQHLTLRIDHLVPIKVYQKNNPLGVDVICNAFNDAAKSLSIDVKAKLVLFKLFDNMVMTKLGGLFQSLNQLLIEANILPSLKQAVRAKRPGPSTQEHYGSGLSASLTEEEASAPQVNKAGGGTAQVGGGIVTSYDDQTNQVLHSLRDLLGSRGGARGAGERIAGGEVVASQDLVRILSLAQHQNTFTQAPVNGAVTPINIRDLLQSLLINEHQKPQAINAVDDDVINLVSMMFDFILDDRNLASPMKALIGRLQIPMVKVAIADKTFFSKGGHPARRLLNEMAMAALGWQESSEENQRKDSLFNKMESIVQTILSDFETDMAIFNNLLTDFRSFLEKDKRRAQILEQRTIDAEDGKAKSERARLQVDSVLNRLTSGHDLPLPAQKLLRDAWGNVLFIISLKQGVESPEWQAGIRTAQQLVWSLTAPMSKENRQGLLKLVPQLLQKLRVGLEDISYSPFETTQLFKQLETLHLARLRSVPKIEDAPAAPQIKVKLADVPTPAVAVTRVKVAEVPAPVTAAPKAELAEVVADAADEISSATNVSAANEPVVDSVVEEITPVSVVSVVADVAAESTNDVMQATQVEAVDIPVLEEVVATPAVEPLVPVGATLESLETFVVVNDEPLFDVGADSLPEGDQHLSLVGNLTQGSWFEMQSEDGQKFRSRLAAIIRATGKYIFVNRSGVKVAEETRMSLALALKSGRLQVLDDGMLFDRALEAVIGNLRSSR
ncbi:hypothetical protein GCM10011613_03200 [Cellvibrio zantedeschiae]|uniref:Thymidine phosphorylase n=1 Tax=Cellvibrio zantedeschiae TaxID=1237077 RepID=A0ABQ3ARC5_9GAMM|nr:DUF1631 domain-containing protein [Cellvibrio zantedeschiae]GGY62980.1 hypothetical protein GCM10011613_03200 [Cellvibrio zantedeschiae]